MRNVRGAECGHTAAVLVASAAASVCRTVAANVGASAYGDVDKLCSISLSDALMYFGAKRRTLCCDADGNQRECQ